MKINQDKVNERLENVDPKHRVFIYDGSLIIEFLRSTFMPLSFLMPNVVVKVGDQLKSKEFKDHAREHKMLMRDLYQLYLLWREEKDYTKKIESRYIFSLIVRHLRLYKNGWELFVYRVGRDQIWYAGPLMLRTDVPKHLQTPAPEPPTASESEVEANPIHDPSEDETPQDDENEPEETLSGTSGGNEETSPIPVSSLTPPSTEPNIFGSPGQNGLPGPALHPTDEQGITGPNAPLPEF